MTIDADRPFAPPADPLAGTQVLEVHGNDIAVALLTLACSLVVAWCGISGILRLSDALVLHLCVVGIPAGLLVMRALQGSDLTIPMLLLVATCAGGPIGAAGCTLMALALQRQRPSPTRLRDWYDHIAGIVARSQSTHIYDELVSGRLPSDPAASVYRFAPVLTGPSVKEQQRVLGVVGRRYHGDFRPVLKQALRNRNGLIRAQAAAIASRLDLKEKTRLWSSAPAAEQNPSDGGERRTQSAEG